jgi:hypothetical protein
MCTCVLEHCKAVLPIRVAAWCKTWVCGRSFAGNAGSNQAGGMDVCLLWVSYVVRGEVSATGRPLVQRSPTECGVSECDRGTSYRRPRPARAVEPREKKKHRFGVVTISDRLHSIHAITIYCPKPSEKM